MCPFVVFDDYSKRPWEVRRTREKSTLFEVNEWGGFLFRIGFSMPDGRAQTNKCAKNTKGPYETTEIESAKYNKTTYNL